MRERWPVAWELIVQLPCNPVTGTAKQPTRTVHGPKR